MLLNDVVLSRRTSSLGNDFFVEVKPIGLTSPILVEKNISVAKQLGLSKNIFLTDHFKQVFSGNQSLNHFIPLAQDYAGHQFGRFNPFLGDGRSALIAEIDTPKGIWDICLKGIGPTPFTYVSDGYASLSECLHEYEVGRRLSALGVPTALGLCVMSGNKKIYRRGFEPAAILARVAESHIRFGTFENYYFQRNFSALKILADHVIHYFYPECEEYKEQRYVHFFRAVVIKTAQLIAHWQVAGFTHGMMNTDNQSIVGITLDLGSATFFDDKNHSANAETNIDEANRYAFDQQPIIGLWNCNVLAKALSPLIEASDLRAALSCYEIEYLTYYEKLKVKQESNSF